MRYILLPLAYEHFLEAYLGKEGRCGRRVVVIPRLGVLRRSSGAGVHWGRGLHRGRGGSWERQRQVGTLALDQSGVQAVGVLGGVACFHRRRLRGLRLRPAGVGRHAVGVVGIGAGLVDVPQVAQVGLVGAPALGSVLVLEVGQVDAVHLLDLSGGEEFIGELCMFKEL